MINVRLGCDFCLNMLHMHHSGCHIYDRHFYGTFCLKCLDKVYFVTTVVLEGIVPFYRGLLQAFYYIV